MCLESALNDSLHVDITDPSISLCENCVINVMICSCVGVLGSMFSFLQYLTSPVTGAVSDVYGRKPVMMLTSVITVALTYMILTSVTLQLQARS